MKSTPLTLTRRGFVQLGGTLFVSLAMPVRAFAFAADAGVTGAGAALPQDPAQPQPPTGTRPASAWIEIHSDNTITVRTGRAEIGTGMSGFYPQVVAEELNVKPGTITLIMGDTDATPDGGFSAGFLSGAKNLRKVSAYTYQALLGLAATQLGVAASDLTVTDGIVSGGGKRVSYGELIRGQQLELSIPVKGKFAEMDRTHFAGVNGLDGLEVDGDPPTKPVSEYKVIGTSFPMTVIPDKVTGKTEWTCDVTLPGMLHARMVRPATMGSKLVSLGTLDKKKYPNAQIVRKANLVAVLSPNEWEAVAAAQEVAASTKWTDWSGLPGSENVTKLLRDYKYGKPDESKGNADGVKAAFASAVKTVSATYEQPYVRHAPIGPYLAVADVRGDGTATIWTHSAQSHGLRAQIANMLGLQPDKVVVRWRSHAAQFGRTTLSTAGAEADAAILSQITGKPVRVQWTLQEDMEWSVASPAWIADVKAAFGADNRLTAVHTANYSPTSFDSRAFGAILAGMPTSISTGKNWIATEWPYDRIPNKLEEASTTPNIAADSMAGGLRGNIMRTPGQRQQNFALEGLMTEAAAAVGADPLQFRIDHTSDQRLIDIINATAKAAGWDSRPSPRANARKTGSTPLIGRGAAIMTRSNGYWTGIAEIEVIPETGIVRVTKFTLGAEVGKVINPRQLNRVMTSGVVMGVSEALKEEVTFDRKRVTSTDWSTYKILTMAETPEIQIVQLSRDDKGFGGGSEAANALPLPAVAAAFFDATGVVPRRLPLTPAYVKSLLKG